MRSEFFRLEMPLHEEMSFHKWEFRAEQNPDPCVALITGLHGDELNGPYIAWKLIRHFRTGAAKLRRGTLRIVPAANPLAINLSSQCWPFDQTDINALFPGYEQGETTQRIAAVLFQELSTSDWCINIHSATEMLQEAPQVRLYEAGHDAEAQARLFRLPLIWKRRATHPLVRMILASQMAEIGVPAFTLHVGAARRLNRFLSESVFTGILSFLAGMGMIDPVPAAKASETVTVMDDQIIEVAAPSAGLFLVDTQLGDRIARDEVIGRILDPISADEPLEVRAPTAGLLSTIKVHPLTYEGDLIARIAAA